MDTKEGILVVGDRGRFILPGGGAKRNESRRAAAIRELREETGLRATKTTYLFPYEGSAFRGKGGQLIRNEHKVFLLETNGEASPKSEIRRIAYYKNENVELSRGSREIIEAYQRNKMEWLKCDYCGTSYRPKDTKNCPKCGAPK